MFAKSRDYTFINYLLPESLVFTCARILFLVSFWRIMLFLVSFLFVALLDPFDPYSQFKFLIFYSSLLYTLDITLSIKQFSYLMHLASMNALAVLVNTCEVLIKYREII